MPQTPGVPPVRLLVKPWRPDLPDLGGYSAHVVNVIPLTQMSYGPARGLTKYGTSALPAKCLTGTSASDSAGNPAIFAGTAANLYRMASGATTFSSVSKSANAYTVANTHAWSFAQVGNNLIATNVADAIQSFVLGSSSAFADLSADAPKAKYAAGIKSFLMVANTFDGIDGAVPGRAWWSAINDPTSWPTIGSAAAAAAQSDYNDIIGQSGAVTGIVGNLGTADGALFLEHGVFRIVYTGPPQVFDFFPAEGARGCLAPQSIVQVGSLVYYLGEDGFYVFDGTNSIPIGANKFDKTFFSMLNTTNIYRVVGASDPVNRLIYWAFPSTSSVTGNPDYILVYNWYTKEASLLETSCETLFRTVSLGYNLDTLHNTGYNLDTLPFSLDSTTWVGGITQLGGVDTTHFYSVFNGANLAASVDTEEIQPFPGQRTLVTMGRALADSVEYSISIATRNIQTESSNYGAPYSVNTSRRVGTCPMRRNARYIKARIAFPAGSTFFQIFGVELDVAPAGKR